MEQRLAGKTVIVTGAASGMGEQHARYMATLGAKVVMTDIQDEAGAAIARDIGENALFVRHDVSAEDDWTRVVDATLDRFGPMHGLVNNAAIGGGSPFDDLTQEVFNRFMSINTVSVLLGMRAVVPHMKKLGGGSIVNVSSIAGKFGGRGAIAYTASKFAVTGMTKAAALDLGEFGIRVNSIHPGAIETPMLAGSRDLVQQLFARIPLGRIGRTDEVSGMAAFLISDDSTFCSGAEFVVDGGQTCQQ